MTSSVITPSLDQPASSGLRLRAVARHSQPSSSVDSCPAESAIEPVLVIGQINCPRSNRLMNRHSPMPSCQSSFSKFRGVRGRRTPLR